MGEISNSMSVWICTQPRERCPCVCCQLWRCEKERDEARAWARYWRAAHAAESRARMEWPEAPAEEEPEWLERDPGPEKEGNDRGAIG